jgi:hypothetical protein
VAASQTRKLADVSSEECTERSATSGSGPGPALSNCCLKLTGWRPQLKRGTLVATRGRFHEVFPPVMEGNHLFHQVNLPA